jgi:hypothetical protein
VSEAFAAVPDRLGRVVGVLPAAGPIGASPDRRAAPDGYPNPWVEIPIYTHLHLSGAQGHDPMSRNHINVLSSDVVVALPGGAGTASEVALALRYDRPAIAYVDDRAQIEGLPGAAVIARELSEVQAFVRAHAFAHEPAGAT